MRPLVISHAACGGHAPENTLAGIRKAIELGADAIEIDVQASADGVPVLMHDLTVDRTTNGTGAVAQLTLAELRALDAGGEPVPTLAEVLDLTKGKVLLVMEIKQAGIEEHIVRVVRDAGARNDVMAWSFLPPALAGMRQADPGIAGALLVAGPSLTQWPKMRHIALKTGLQGVSVYCDGLTPVIAEDCRRSGLALYSWTADSRSQIQTLIDLDVDGICSNFPDRVISALNEG
ncbi:MAG: glycerophosphodiester phosphodiesterase family protein [Dehalococcoidia bacterium]